MTLSFPSPAFGDAVSAVCHGTATEAEMKALNQLLRTNPAARDEYLMRVELHSRLASDKDLFSGGTSDVIAEAAPAGPRPQDPGNILPLPGTRYRPLVRVLALAACLVFLAGGAWTVWHLRSTSREATTSKAVAMLARTVDARWTGRTAPPRVGSALEPGWLRIESGLAQVVFYSGARVVIEGPTELKIVSPREAVCLSGRLLAEVPEPARGFRVKTSQMDIVDRGTAFGIQAAKGKTAVHVFQGEVEFSAGANAKQALDQGRAASVQGSARPEFVAADPEIFAPMFEFQKRSLASEALRYDQWRLRSAQLSRDSSLIVHFDFEHLAESDWTLRNRGNPAVQDGTIVGCQHGEGRWREKQALEFQSVNDRVRMAIPGEFQAMTLSAWVCVKGLDRQFNSLFMSDGFQPGTVHWLIRHDGVLGLTVFGEGVGNYQITTSPPLITLRKLGMWIHVAAVVDGAAMQVVHYVNGSPVARHPLKIGPPFRAGAAELGNWNARSGPNPAPVLIRNLSGSLDEFELFSRALSDIEVQELYLMGKPDL